MTMTDHPAGRHLRAVHPPDAPDTDAPAVKAMGDLGCEQIVLGLMMSSPRHVEDAVDRLVGADFYAGKHETIWAAIVALWAGGNPTDPEAVATHLAATGDLMAVGGAPYLHTIIARVPLSAGTLGFHANVIRDWARRRRIHETGIRITRTAANLGVDVDDVAEAAQRDIHEATVRRVTATVQARDYVDDEFAHLEDIRDGKIEPGISTGFGELDALLGGWHPGRMVIPAGRPGMGKALALDTPLPTPDGWTTMGEVKAGDRLLGPDGLPTTVLGAWAIMRDRPCYEVEFSDGSVIVADGEHLWKTTTRASRRQRTENRSTHQWPADARASVDDALRAAMDRPDELVSFGEAVEFAGEQFRKVLHRVAAEVGHSGEVTREYVRRGQPWRQRVRAYSRQALIGALAKRVNRLMNAETTAAPAEPVTTEQIAATLRLPTDGRLNHAVENSRPLTLPTRVDLPVPPYTLGAWLGDGHSRVPQITTTDPEVVAYLEADGFLLHQTSSPITYRIKLPAVPDRDEADRRGGCANCGKSTAGIAAGSRRCSSCHSRFGSFAGHLRAAGVLRNKHIPIAYLRASEAQRRQLLAGLMDTDGTVTRGGCLQFAVTSRRLAEGARELIVSLGYRCSITTKRVKGRTPESSTCYTLTFSAADDIFRLERKRIAHKERRSAENTTRTKARYIVAVRRVPSVPVRCVTVDNAEHMYLAGRSMIPTHNTILALNWALHAARRGHPVLLFPMEMTKRELMWRFWANLAEVNTNNFQRAHFTSVEWKRLADARDEIRHLPIGVDDRANTVAQIVANSRRFAQKHGRPGLIVPDYVQRLILPGKDRHDLEVGRAAQAFKELAKELETTLVPVCQINRGNEARADKIPQLSDLRDSGQLEQEADQVVLIYRPDYYDKENERAGEADLIVAKNRHGATDTVHVAAQLHYARFVDMGLPEGSYR